MARATLIGFSAVAMWALLALLTDASGRTPPFLLSAITFAIGTVVGLAARHLHAGAATSRRRYRSQVWVIGIAGLFGYHFFYFTALRNAPAVEASLIAYLWPLLIVLGSALMPGERLRWNHVAGALLGLAGTVLIVTKGGGARFREPLSSSAMRWPASAPSFGRPIRCCRAASRRCRPASSPGSAPPRRRFRLPAISRWRRPCCRRRAGQWLAVVGLGLMPVGAAFYAWDIGVKRGNIQVLGAASYAAPLLSTLMLIVTGFAEPILRILAACLLITGGAVLAAKSMLFGRKAASAAADNAAA